MTPHVELFRHKFEQLAFFFLFLALPTLTQAEICKYLDGEGNMHYTNAQPEIGWKKLSCGVEAEGECPEKDVLTETLATEEKLLAESRVAYGDGAPTPLPDEKDNVQRYAERLRKLRQAVALHTKNVASLRKDIGAYEDGSRSCVPIKTSGQKAAPPSPPSAAKGSVAPRPTSLTTGCKPGWRRGDPKINSFEDADHCYATRRVAEFDAIFDSCMAKVNNAAHCANVAATAVSANK